VALSGFSLNQLLFYSFDLLTNSRTALLDGFSSAGLLTSRY